MGADHDGSERVEGILMGFFADAMAALPLQEQSAVLDRLLAGEDAMSVELSGSQLVVYVFGVQVAVRSVLWLNERLGGANRADPDGNSAAERES